MFRSFTGWRGEAPAGASTFFSMLYIGVVVPSLLRGITGLSHEEMIVRTFILCALGTIFFGTVTNLPYAAGPGIVPTMLLVGFSQSGIPWKELQWISLEAGLLISVLAWTGVLTRVAAQTPAEVKTSVTYAIGFYLMAVALKASGIAVSPSPFFHFNLKGSGFPFLIGLGVAFLVELRWKKELAILSGIAVATVASKLPGFSAGLLTGAHSGHVVEVLTLTYVLVADIVATFEVMSRQSKALRETDGTPKNLRRSLVASGVLCMLGPALGFVPVVVFFESVAGILAGGRTRACSLMVGVGFAIVSIATPLATVVPPFASAIAIAIIGGNIAKSPWRFMETTRETRYLFYVALLAALLFGSVTLTVLSAFAVYPIALYRAKRPVRRADWAAFSMSVFLIAVEGLR